jgi:acyl carrier protein
VEPGEVEAALVEHPGVRAAAVLAREDAPGDRRLVAYVVPGGGGEEVSPQGLRAHLRARLPEYMVPSAVVLLDALPLTASGKVDRNALPAPGGAGAGSAGGYVAPRGPVEEAVAGVWAEVLGVERVGAHDNFFELGGHSLLATQVLSRLREAFPVNIPLRRLFEAPTVANLALAITESQAEPKNGPISKVGLGDDDQILSRLDQLSDEEVDSLLHEALAEEEAR